MTNLLNPTLLFLLFWFLVRELSFVKAARIPSKRVVNLKRREASVGVIDVGGLDVLKSYVCPSGFSNAFQHRENTARGATVTVAIPAEEAAQLWQELYWIMDQLGTILEAEGLIPESARASALQCISSSLISISIPMTPLSTPPAEVSIPSVTNSIVSTSSSVPSPSSTFLILTSTSRAAAVGAFDRPKLSPVSTSSSILSLTTADLSDIPTTSTEEIPGTTPTPLLTTGTKPNASADESIPTYVPTLKGEPTIVGFMAATSTITNLELTSSDCSATATETIQETTTVHLTALVTRDNATITRTTNNIFTSTDNVPASAAASSTLSLSRLSFTNGIKLVATATGPSNALATGSSSYVFDPQSTRNIAVYFGQTLVTGGTTLEAQCADPNIDIVILAFLISATDQGKYPGVNFGAACSVQTQAMIAQAPGLLSCTELEGFIEQCQTTYGKKVLLSIGGAASSITFSSASDASNFADILWQLFGPPGSIDPDLRPFGNVSIDGFDFDNENNHPDNYDILASTLRTKYKTDSSKSYYLSSAPQCPFPDASNPLNMLLICDFVFVQFYNNGPCEIGSSDFHDSIQQWSTALAASTINPKPRLYIGAPAWSAAGPTAYAHIGSAKGMQEVAADVTGLGVPNLGGVMFWDGPEAMLNLEGGKDILEWTKEGLEG